MSFFISSSLNKALKGTFTKGSYFDANIILYKNNDMLAGGSFSINQVSSEFTKYSAPIKYFSETETADSAWIILSIGGDEVSRQAMKFISTTLN